MRKPGSFGAGFASAVRSMASLYCPYEQRVCMQSIYARFFTAAVLVLMFLTSYMLHYITWLCVYFKTVWKMFKRRVGLKPHLAHHVRWKWLKKLADAFSCISYLKPANFKIEDEKKKTKGFLRICKHTNWENKTAKIFLITQPKLSILSVLWFLYSAESFKNQFLKEQKWSISI